MRGPGERVGRRLDILAIVGLVCWLTFDLTARTVFGSVPWPQSVVDYRILYEAGRDVVRTHQYPAGYPYPPPAAALHAATALLPFEFAAPMWLAVTGLAAVVSYLALARVLGLYSRPGALLVLPLAHVVVAYYFQWDMRSINCNLIVLAAILSGCAALAAGRDAAAGFWFALSVALKLLPVLLLPYLAWTRRWRAFAWAVGFSLVFWIGVPLVTFGGSGVRTVYGGWTDEMTRATDPNAKRTHPILISLDKAALYLTADATASRAVSLGVCGLWFALGLAGAAAAWGRRERDGFAILAHASLLVLGPVAVNPYLEPYHLVPLVVPTVLLLAAAADARQGRRVRTAAAVGFVLGMVILKASSPWPLRGLLVNAQALVLCGTAVWVAWVRVSGTAPGGTADVSLRRLRLRALLGRLNPVRVACICEPRPQQ
ncbi:MAG: DUF2029 domain-containing protein [Planctomycetes bacterium]|nr:DUF2029 domain-containing protein [Planctomycetota bacterium]